MDRLPPAQNSPPPVSWQTGVIWMGCGFGALWRLLASHRFRLPLRSLPACACDVSCALFNSTLGGLQDLLLARSLKRIVLNDDPLLVVGHWRSGTTLLHELLALDARHRCPTNYECFVPRHFLISQRWLKPCIGFLLPKNRLADSMPVEWDLPQEDEFALVALGVPSPYLSIAFPNEPPQFGRYYALDGLSPGELVRWQQTLTRFLRQLIWNRPGRLVLKSPPHTFRLPVLEQLFPRARYLHLVRDPYAVFASTVKLWKSLFAAQSYQRPTYEGLEERVLETFCRMYERFESARLQIDPHRICDVRYEDLVRDPLGQMRQVYERLELGDFDLVAAAVEAYFGQRADYRPSRYQLTPQQHAAVTERWLPYMRRYGYESRDSTAGMT
ncbi:MAG: sulfotransferase [Pirellulaceae bacterium]|nr:sulfotransferase [Pirellulaceae bacterium]